MFSVRSKLGSVATKAAPVIGNNAGKLSTQKIGTSTQAHDYVNYGSLFKLMSAEYSRVDKRVSDLTARIVAVENQIRDKDSLQSKAGNIAQEAVKEAATRAMQDVGMKSLQYAFKKGLEIAIEIWERSQNGSNK